MDPCRLSKILYAAVGLIAAFGMLASQPTAHAGERRSADYPYGESRGGYGEKKAVSNAQEARRMIRDYFAGKNVKIGELREHELFFEADIRDKRGALVDKVIIDKRTGRIRSMY